MDLLWRSHCEISRHNQGSFWEKPGFLERGSHINKMMKQGHQVSPLNTEGSIWLHSQPRITIGSCGQNQQCLFLLITTLLPRISFLVKCTWRSVTQQGQAVEYTSVLIAAILREHRFFFFTSGSSVTLSSRVSGQQEISDISAYCEVAFQRGFHVTHASFELLIPLLPGTCYHAQLSECLLFPEFTRIACQASAGPQCKAPRWI